jgi:hypothetical protein
MSGGAYAGHLGLHELAKRRQWICAYCDRKTHCPTCNPHLDGQLQATRDHRVPKSKGGRDNARNLVLACFRCNQDKADRLPEGAGVVELAVAQGCDVPSLPDVPRRRTGRTRLTQPVWQACGPNWYKSEWLAGVAADAIPAATGSTFEAFHCQFCQRWHIAPAKESAAV